MPWADNFVLYLVSLALFIYKMGNNTMEFQPRNFNLPFFDRNSIVLSTCHAHFIAKNFPDNTKFNTNLTIQAVHILFISRKNGQL